MDSCWFSWRSCRDKDGLFIISIITRPRTYNISIPHSYGNIANPVRGLGHPGIRQELVKVNDFSLMGRIQKLDETVVLRIAAGEVSCTGAFGIERILAR